LVIYQWSLQNVQGQRGHTRPHPKPYPDPKLNPKPYPKALTLNPITNPIWCDPVDPVSLYILQWPIITTGIGDSNRNNKINHTFSYGTP